MFRKWRFEVSNGDLRAVDKYIFNIKMRNKIQSRINYEKRKSKALTALAFRMTKIKLRNYFQKYWSNVKGQTIDKFRDEVDQNRNKFSELRKDDKMTQS